MPFNHLEFLARNLYKIDGEIMPCKEAEIALFEDALGTKLPQAYREFLLIMGKGSGELIADCDLNFSWLQDMQKEAEKILARNVKKTLPDGHFVFLIHQNYSFKTFILNSDDDPHLYTFVDGDEPLFLHPDRVKFSDFIFNELDLYLKVKAYNQGETKQRPQKGPPFFLNKS
jgi:hypothetical protein